MPFCVPWYSFNLANIVAIGLGFPYYRVAHPCSNEVLTSKLRPLTSPILDVMSILNRIHSLNQLDQTSGLYSYVTEWRIQKLRYYSGRSTTSCIAFSNFPGAGAANY